ncbi:MAG TPA: LysR family transcriptional regulator [Bacillales bacterium]|nr:LysR family transcriptional regulator [Bacillales bacterium]
MDQQLDVFVTVAEKKNFSRAAEVLHMTQPAVSQYIKQLEREMDTKLLERTNKMVRLTKAGEVVYHHAKEILSLSKRMRTLVDDMMHTASGPLAIGASYTFGEYVLPHLIARLRDKYPLIQPTIFIGNTRLVAEKVGGRQLDIGIVEGEVHQPKVYTEPLANDYMEVVVHTGHRLAGRERIAFSDLKDETWIVREEGSGTREMTERMFEDHEFQPKSMMKFGSTQVIKESVEAGLGISFLSKWAIRKELALGTLKTLPIEEFPFMRQFSLITQDTPFQTKASEVFWDLLHEKISEMANN